MGLMPKYYLLAGHTSDVSIFFSLHKIKMSKLDYLSSKLSLTFRVIMLAISAKSSHSCLLCLCGKREYPVSFQNKLVSSSFK